MLLTEAGIQTSGAKASACSLLASLAAASEKGTNGFVQEEQPLPSSFCIFVLSSG